MSWLDPPELRLLPCCELAAQWSCLDGVDSYTCPAHEHHRVPCPGHEPAVRLDEPRNRFGVPLRLEGRPSRPITAPITSSSRRAAP